MPKYLTASFFFVISINIEVFGQNLPSIQLDRPDQTECPFIVPKGYIQAENGLTYEKNNKLSTSIAHPSTLWKYGFSDNFEFRLITEVISEKELSQVNTGLSPITVGFKVKMMEENGILPITSFIGHLAVPNWASKSFEANYFAPSFRFTMQHTLSKRMSLAYNLGAEWDGETPETSFIYTLTTGYSLTEKLGGYLELYGFAPQNQETDHRFDGGLTYLINNNVIFDISGGFGLSPNSPLHFISLGFSYRFKIKKS
jgi:hypothetical protein